VKLIKHQKILKMKLSDFKKELSVAKAINFIQPNGELVPAHFHITQVGLATKHFYDCGVSVHVEKLASFQIWVDTDTEHRLKPLSLLQILAHTENILGDEDLEIEVEYQNETIGKYALGHKGDSFILLPKYTECLAKDICIPVSKPKMQFLELSTSNAGICTPGGGCC
jgi:hypothetical protein